MLKVDLSLEFFFILFVRYWSLAMWTVVVRGTLYLQLSLKQCKHIKWSKTQNMFIIYLTEYHYQSLKILKKFKMQLHR